MLQISRKLRALLDKVHKTLLIDLYLSEYSNNEIDEKNMVEVTFIEDTMIFSLMRNKTVYIFS